MQLYKKIHVIIFAYFFLLIIGRKVAYFSDSGLVYKNVFLWKHRAQSTSCGFWDIHTIYYMRALFLKIISSYKFNTLHHNIQHYGHFKFYSIVIHWSMFYIIFEFLRFSQFILNSFVTSGKCQASSVIENRKNSFCSAKCKPGYFFSVLLFLNCKTD